MLLIETGETPSASSHVPAFFSSPIGSPEDHAYEVEPERLGCHGLEDGIVQVGEGQGPGR